MKYSRKGIYNFKNQTSWQKVKNMNHFVFLSFYFGAKMGYRRKPSNPHGLGCHLTVSRLCLLISH